MLYLDALGSIGTHADPHEPQQLNVELIECDYTDDGTARSDPINDAAPPDAERHVHRSASRS